MLFLCLWLSYEVHGVENHTHDKDCAPYGASFIGGLKGAHNKNKTRLKKGIYISGTDQHKAELKNRLHEDVGSGFGGFFAKESPPDKKREGVATMVWAVIDPKTGKETEYFKYKVCGVCVVSSLWGFPVLPLLYRPHRCHTYRYARCYRY
jgi:hypothetical protein